VEAGVAGVAAFSDSPPIAPIAGSVISAARGSK
jgi:hypothetical protein